MSTSQRLQQDDSGGPATLTRRPGRPHRDALNAWFCTFGLVVQRGFGQAAGSGLRQAAFRARRIYSLRSRRPAAPTWRRPGAAKHLAWLSVWSAGRDTECPGGVDTSAQPTCSGIVQTSQEFMETLGQH